MHRAGNWFMHLDVRELEVLPVNRMIGMCIVAEWMGWTSRQTSGRRFWGRPNNTSIYSEAEEEQTLKEEWLDGRKTQLGCRES